MYCSDVQGAFDKVDAELLICKLASFNLESCIIVVVRSWLRTWSAFVIVNGKRSRPIRLRNIVFQGTVWGLTLRNASFRDCGFVIRACGFDLVVYIDDVQVYSRSVTNRAIEADLRKCKLATHSWGAANSVTFDARKKKQ